MKLDMVERMPSDVLGVLADLLQKLSGNDGALWLERLKLFLKGENPFSTTAQTVNAWADELISGTRRKLKKFFRRSVQVESVPASWTPAFLANAAAYNMRPVFLPDADISASWVRKGWVKLESWFYERIASGAIKGDHPTRLKRGWYLADFTPGTDYTNGTQVLPSDPWSPLITELRGAKLIKGYDATPSGSRFAITWDEWNDCVLAQMAAKLSVHRVQISLERAVEFNAIGNIYDPTRGAFNMWVWLQDKFEDDYRLVGGNRGVGGLARVNYSSHAHRYDSIAARPLVRFVQ